MGGMPLDFKLGPPLAGNAQADSARLRTGQSWGLAPTIDDGAGRVRVEWSLETGQRAGPIQLPGQKPHHPLTT